VVSVDVFGRCCKKKLRGSKSIAFDSWRRGLMASHRPTWSELRMADNLADETDEQPIAVPIVLR